MTSPRNRRRTAAPNPLQKKRAESDKILDIVTIEHPGVEKGLRYLARNFSRPIKIPEIALVAGLSQRGLHKAFWTHLGRSPGSVLRGIRILRAADLLAGSDLTLKDVAARSGFRNSNSFWVAFRNATGMAPRGFRRNRKTIPTLKGTRIAFLGSFGKDGRPRL